MDFEYEIKNGEVTIIGYNNKLATEINIPETIEGYKVTKIDYLGFNGCIELVSITIPNSIVDIDEGSLAYCVSLRVINGILIVNNFCVINNRFVFYNNVTYKIMYQVGYDYYCVYNYYEDEVRFFINNRKYCGDFRR